MPRGQGGVLDDLVVVVPLPGREEGAADELLGVRLADGATHPRVEVHVRLLLQHAPENLSWLTYVPSPYLTLLTSFHHCRQSD